MNRGKKIKNEFRKDILLIFLLKKFKSYKKKVSKLLCVKNDKTKFMANIKMTILTHPGMVVELSLPNFLQQEQLKTGFYYFSQIKESLYPRVIWA